MYLIDTKEEKIVRSSNYNSIFNKKTGFFARWGKTKDEDPDYSPYGNEIADIEISTICNGVDGIGPCKFCYKANTGKGEYMSFDTFKTVFHRLPKITNQIAFGIGDIPANPDMWKIFDYCRENGVIPNVTVNGQGTTDEVATKLVEKCGAIAVSLYDEDKTFDTIKKLTDLGLKQCNIHFMISEETYDKALDLLKRVKTEPRLEKLNAIVFLSLKQKGRAKKNFTKLSLDKFKSLFEYAIENNINIGFDSCSAQKAFQSIKGTQYEERFSQFIEPCESTRMSIYADVNAKIYPCSFSPGIDGWEDGISMLTEDFDFMRDVWNNERTIQFRNKCIDCNKNGISCPADFEI